MADFAASGCQDEVRIDGDGRLVLTRRLGEKGPRRLRFWLHFVNMPVQVGALTSPQSMQAPLAVEAAGPGR